MVKSGAALAAALWLSSCFMAFPAWTADADPVAVKPLMPLPAFDRGAPLSFNDEFQALPAAPEGHGGWKTRFSNGDRTLPSNHEAEFYADATTGNDPFRIIDGQLEITARPCDGHATLPYCSGLITSQTHFAQKYGYFEMRARLPAGKGLWPAFWLLPSGGGWPPEIDVMEMLGDQSDQIYISVHWKAAEHLSKTTKVRVTSTSDGFHIYAVSWHPDFLRWYFDGSEIARLPTPPGLDRPMYLLVNLAVGGAGSWPGPPDAATAFPAKMRVDYVRAYRYQPEKRPGIDALAGPVRFTPAGSMPMASDGLEDSEP